MLKAYEYIEYDQNAGSPKGFWDQSLREREIELSKAFWDNHIHREHQICPVCGEERLRIFYKKWGGLTLDAKAVIVYLLA